MSINQDKTSQKLGETSLTRIIARLKTGVSQRVLPEEERAFESYLDPKEDSNSFHWYCFRGSTLLRDIATFSQQKLVATAQDDARIHKWKQQHSFLMDSCPDCVKAMEESLLESQTTFLSAYKRERVSAYLDVHFEWNAQRILAHLDSLKSSTLAALPLAVSYHLIYNPYLLSHPKIWPLALEHLPEAAIVGWPKGTPPGLALLLVQSDGRSRQWARIQMRSLDRAPEDPSNTDNYSRRVCSAIVGALDASTGFNITLPLEFPFRLPFNGLPSSTLWATIGSMTHQFGELCEARVQSHDSKSGKANPAQTLLSLSVRHLSRTDKAFLPVLRAFTYVLESRKEATWVNHPPELPQLALDSLRDNPCLCAFDTEKESATANHFGWIEPFLQSTMVLPTSNELVHRVVQLFAEQTQHERFGHRRPLIFNQFMRALMMVFSLHREDTSHKKAIMEATGVHQAAILAIAFAKKFNDPAWLVARNSTRKFLFKILEFDIAQVHSALCSISSAEKTKDFDPILIPPSYSVLWSQLRASLVSDDLEAYAFLFKATARAANLVAIPPERVENALSQSKSPVLNQNLRIELRRAADSIEIMQTGFGGCVLRLVSVTSTATLAAFCHRDDVAAATVALLLSPAAELSNSAQSLLAQAYNTDSRVDTLRLLLEFQCEITLNGMVTRLQQFLESSRMYLEHVRAAKVVVVHFTDVLEVLCARGSGLLFNPSFTTKNTAGLKHLPQLWSVMCEAAGDIIKRTPDWARRYPPHEMTPWMRDALIFADQLLEQRHVFEATIRDLGSIEASTSGTSLAETAERILKPLVSWLRLTDDELLGRSFDLFLKIVDAFIETHTKPAEELISSIESMLLRWDRNLNQPKVKEGKTISTKLSSAQIGTGIRRMSQLRGEEDSDIEFISQSFSPQKPKSSNASRGSFREQPSNIRTRTQMKLDWPSNYPHITRVPHTSGVTAARGPAKFDQTMVQKAIEERRASKKTTTKLPDNSKPMDLGHKASSSESSDSEGESGFQQLIKLQELREKPKNQEKRRAILLNGNIKTSRIEVGQRVKTKFIPDLTPLHRIILSWNYDHTGPEPPDSTSFVYKPVPDSFWGHRQYLEIFHPLLLLECWNSLVKSKEEHLEKVQCTVAGKMITDIWVEVDVSIERTTHSVCILAETDIVLLEHASGVRALAKVHSFRDTREGLQATLRYSKDDAKLDFERSMALQSSWLVTRVFSLSTVHREYAALLGLSSYEFEDSVLQARLEPHSAPTEESISRTMAAQKLNYPQARAVLSSLHTRGFSLIQGPPGTGKTSTICGLVGAFLSSRDSATTSITVGGPSQKPIPRKVLVCAPSNAAIDEVARRIHEGVWKSDGQRTRPQVVRLGPISAMSLGVRDISLDRMVENRLSGTESTGEDSSIEVSSLRGRLAHIKQLRHEKQMELSAVNDNTARALELDRELRELTSNRTQLTSQLNAALDKGKERMRAADSAKRKARVEILSEADVVCCTLSGSGHEFIDRTEFDLVIIDEAAQAIELSSLIPLKFASQRCILVGDPQQLPPTVLSQTATKMGYNRSLFVRLQDSMPDRIHLLSIQYRMHPEISRLPSVLFYERKLQDGPDMAVKTRRPWHDDSNLGVYRLFDIRGNEEQADLGYSQYNLAEVKAALELYKRLSATLRTPTEVTIGIISMYRAQLTKLRDAFIARYGREILSKVDFNTVDGFQGQEKDVIILSCVRAGPNVSSIGFLSDARRINVAITRCRSSLFILGDAATLRRSDQLWSKIIEDANSRGSLLQVHDGDPPGSRFSTDGYDRQKYPTTSSRLSQREPNAPQNTLGNKSASTTDTTSAALPATELPTKRRLSSPEDTSREPPALRRGSTAGGVTDSSADIRSRNPLPSQPKAPRARASNLFIPKKPTKLPK